MPAYLLRVSDLSARTKRSRSTIYAEIKKGLFPEPIRVGRASRWREDEIERLLDAYASGAGESHLRSVCADIHNRRKASLA